MIINLWLKPGETEDQWRAKVNLKCSETQCGGHIVRGYKKEVFLTDNEIFNLRIMDGIWCSNCGRLLGAGV